MASPIYGSGRDQVATLVAALRERDGQRLRASDLSKMTGVPKMLVRRFLEGHPRMLISEKPPYMFSWVKPPFERSDP